MRRGAAFSFPVLSARQGRLWCGIRRPWLPRPIYRLRRLWSGAGYSISAAYQPIDGPVGQTQAATPQLPIRATRFDSVRCKPQGYLNLPPRLVVLRFGAGITYQCDGLVLEALENLDRMQSELIQGHWGCRFRWPAPSSLGSCRDSGARSQPSS